MNIKSNKGAALLTTLMIGILALVIILALFTFILFGKGSSVLKERYTTALEAARGTAYFVIKKLDLGATDIKCFSSSNPSQKCDCSSVYFNNSTNSLECEVGTTTITNIDKIDLGSYSTLPAPDGSTYSLDATLIFKDLSKDRNFDIYSIEINATNNKTNEKATIDFIYKAPKQSF